MTGQEVDLNQVFVSWSGGKDSCLACYRAMAGGLKVRYLVNMITENGKHSRAHRLPADLLRLQARAMGIPLVQRRATWNSYETELKKMLRIFKREGIKGGVFGDINLAEHREWVERVCQEVDVVPHLPLWGESQEKILQDLVKLGFEAIIVATKAGMMGEEWLSRRIDLDFIDQSADLKKTKGITPCGEAGEYHTLVIDGPLFQKRLEVRETRKVCKDEHWFLEILSADLRGK
jgi:uncharacterized protein (TIGR00290 family)